jgi:hypothetical protein
VTTAGGTSATGAADQFTFVTPPLLITSISPASGSTLGGTTVTISGSDFVDVTAVDFGTAPAAFLTISNSTITVTTPAEPKGKVDVTVTTTTGTTPTSRSLRFTFLLPPTVRKVSPNSGPTIGGTSVTINGTGFTGATGVDFGGDPATSIVVNSSRSITATSPVEAAGMVDVTVTTPTGTSATASGDAYTFAVPPPVVTSITPATGSTVGGTSVTINGTGFTGAFAVHFGSAEAAIVVDSDVEITATSPPGQVGSAPVTVTNSSGTSRKRAAPFTYVERVTTPVVTGVSPKAGFASTKTSDSVTLTGTGFTGATAVDFGVTPASSFSVLSDTSISATSPPVPPTSAGTVDVTVTTPQGTSTTSPADLFTYVAPGPVATVTGVSPSSGPDTGGTNVVISGTGLTGATTVDFGTISVPFTLDDGNLTATSPPAARGVVDVTVTTPNGASVANSHDEFTFTQPQIPPTVTNIKPHSGPGAGGTKVIISGTGFIGATGVNFGDVPAAFVVSSNDRMSATAPPEPAGTVNVTVITPNGSAVSPVQFTFK